MNAKVDSGKPPKTAKVRTKPKEKAIVNALACATLDGVNARVIEVEATFTKGLPGFSIVGLASSDIQEAKERVNNHSSLYSIKYYCTIF